MCSGSQTRGELVSSFVSQVLWEQDAWNDLVKSLDLRKRVFPWAVGYGLKSDLWPSFGYERVVLSRVQEEFKKSELSHVRREWRAWP